jgi:hypothetical protein
MKKIILILVLGIFLFSFVSAETSFCCEKLKNGAWCMNAPESDCNAQFRKAPTSCEATAFCRLGTCINPQEGTCLENTPQRVCDTNGGFWKIEPAEEITQCKTGCCLIGDQAAFVTQTRCKRLSSFYGLETNFRTDINTEFECIATASSDVKGACVFESEFEKTCKMSTKKECQTMEVNTPKNIFDLFDTTPDNITKVSFYEGRLCSDEALGTNCGPSQKTNCVEGKEEVYFLDTCGNIANIYDSTKARDPNYWSELKNKEESCGNATSNVNSPSCGNCDYYLGSTCKKKDGRNVHMGDYICKDLGCTYEGKSYQHGETWCAQSEGTSTVIIGQEKKIINSSKENLPGSRYFRLVCYNGEVTVEPCADYRAEVCVQSEVNGFSAAACKVNAWQDCGSQETEKDCTDINARDCQWVASGKKDTEDRDNDGNKKEDLYVCTPKYAPGFNFWEDGDAKELCDIASEQCVVTYDKSIAGAWTCDNSKPENNCQCCPKQGGYAGCTGEWTNQKINFCNSLGDCGNTLNYLGIQGDIKDLFVKKNN